VASFLGQAGADSVPRVARRDAGYGFGVPDAVAFADAGCRLIVTLDCGTSDLPAIAAARQRGVDVVVVDHHTVPDRGAGPHPALALVNPFRDDSTFPFRGMASVGLGFYLMAAVRTLLAGQGWFASRPEPDMKALLDLVALGTVADLVPLQGENRILAANGLRALAGRQRPGIAALLASAGVEGDQPVDERTIAWKLAPRLNAPGRLGDAAPALALLLATDEAEARRCAGVLEQANASRREVQDRMLDEADRLLGDADPGPAVVVAAEGWASGVVGIVAAKLVERYQRPAFVIAIDPVTGEGRGSARTTAGTNLYQVLERCQDRLVRFGGHAAAAGLTVRADQVERLREELHAATESVRLAEGSGPTSAARQADAQVELGQVDGGLVTELDSLAPFGNGNDSPLLLARGLRVRHSRRVGADGAHLKLQLEDGTGQVRDAIGFGLGAEEPGPGAALDAAFQPFVSTWKGRTRIELRLEALSRSE
jgi:single-stranded-DNA-specific exonuclease